jgi:hypothetical protein
MIHHLSYPKGVSVNDFISPEYSSVQYTRIQDAISAIKMYQSDVYLAKCDIEWHTGIYHFHRMNIINLVLFGTTSFIMISAWQWVVHLLVKCLKGLVPLWNG